MEIQDVIDDRTFSNAWWGVYVVDMGSGETVYAENAGRSFVPASGTKLFTTAAALDLLGSDYRYETQLFTDGVVQQGVLHGSLIVRGAGDPSVGGARSGTPRIGIFQAWADSLAAAGIAHVSGDIVADDDIFDDTPLGHDWAWDDEVYGYSAQISGLSFHDNTVDISVQARLPGETGVVSWAPLNTSYVTLHNATRTIEAGAQLQEGYQRIRGSNRIILSSQVPQGRTDTEAIAIDNPSLFFAHVLREVLLQRGIGVSGAAVDVDALSIKPQYASLRRLATHRSAPLADIVKIINTFSQNLYAEQVLRTIGTEHPSANESLPPGSAAMGIAAAMRTFSAAHLDTNRLQLVDGSGLSRKNLVTPTMIVQLLQYMADHPDDRVRFTFEASLAVGGKDGTLAGRFTSGHLHVRAKTGTLGNVSSLSGYVDTLRGRRLAFSIVCNHYSVPARRVRRAQDRIVALLAQRP